MIHNHKFFHWLYYKRGKNHVYTIGTGIFIWLFLSLTQPFGVYQNNFPTFLSMLVQLSFFGFSWVFVIYFFDLILLKRQLDKIRNNIRYDFGFWIAKIIVVIHVFIVSRGVFCNWNCIDTFEYFETWLACTMMVLFTYIPFSLYGRFKFFQSIANGVENPEADFFELKGEGKETVTLNLEKIIYIKADDNYVDIFIDDNGSKIEKLVLRSTLKSVEKQLSEFAQFIRIHRSYIINFTCIEDKKRLDTLLINVAGQKISLSVSKKYQAEFEKLISKK